MNGKSALIWLCLAGVAGAVLFETSYEVQGLEEELSGLNRQIVAEQEAIQVLRAEWSFLNNPSRLETLTRAHLTLQPTEARQFLAVEQLPLRPTPAVKEPLPAPGGAPGRTPFVASVTLPPVAPLPTAHTPATAAQQARTAAAKPAAPKPAETRAAAVKPAAGKPAKPPAAPRPAPGATPLPAQTASAPGGDAMAVLLAKLGADQ